MKTHNGFSLIELAIVLIIISFLMGYLLIPISAKKDQQYLKSTQKTLEEIKEALLGFAVRDEYGRLPCVNINDNDGTESKNADETCKSNGEGFLPWLALGVGKDDVWGNPFRYRTEAAFNRMKGIDSTDISSGLRVRNREIEDDTKPSPKKYFHFTRRNGDSRVVAIIFSRGKNHVSDDDNANLLMKTFVHDGYVEDQDDPNNNFDDILTWLSRNTLMNRLTTAKKWPPPPKLSKL
jgi:prepilin-type N-terminal cleavage/methylation domain-containing protein